MTTSLSVHNVYRLAARSQNTLGTPVTIRCARKGENDVEIILFMDNPGLAARLVEAINRVMVVSPVEPN